MESRYNEGRCEQRNAERELVAEPKRERGKEKLPDVRAVARDAQCGRRLQQLQLIVRARPQGFGSWWKRLFNRNGQRSFVG